MQATAEQCLTVGWEETSQAPQAYPEENRLTLRQVCTVDSYAHHFNVHMHMHMRVHLDKRGCTEVSVRQHMEWKMYLNRGHLRDRNCQQNQSFWLTVAKFVFHQGLSCCDARPCVNVICPQWVHDESSFGVWRMASLRNGCSLGLTPCWAPASWINDLTSRSSFTFRPSFSLCVYEPIFHWTSCVCSPVDSSARSVYILYLKVPCGNFLKTNRSCVYMPESSLTKCILCILDVFPSS